MLNVAIDLHDSGLVAAWLDGATLRCLGPSRGCALFDGERLHVGTDASARRRLLPLRAYDRFWHHLDLVSLDPPFPKEWRRADLVYAHLERFKGQLERSLAADSRSEDPAKEPLSYKVILAIGSGVSKQEGERLLGIAQAAELEPVGLVDRAAAAVVTADVDVSASQAEKPCLYLDMELHRALATKFSDGIDKQRLAVRSDDQLGLVAMEELMARWFAEQFVRRTRFDPLHTAQAEQALYDALPGWFEQLIEQPECRISMSLEGREHAMDLRRDSLLEVSGSLYEQLWQLVADDCASDCRLLLSPQLGHLPGLFDFLDARWKASVESLQPGAVVGGVLSAWQLIETADKGASGVAEARRPGTNLEDLESKERQAKGEETEAAGTMDIPWLLSLPALDALERVSSQVSSAAPLAPSAPRPTHVVVGGRAQALSLPYVLGCRLPPQTVGLDIDSLSASSSSAFETFGVLVERGGELWLENTNSNCVLAGETECEIRCLVAGDRLQLGASQVEVELVTF